MKNKIIYSFFTSLFILLFQSCGGEDDICENGEGTPRMNIAFKSQGKITKLDSIKIYTVLGNTIVDLGWKTNADSILVPLRVDDAPYTDLYVKTKKKGDSSKVRIGYTVAAVYVSPGCGFKRNYNALAATILNTNPLLKVDVIQNTLSNENQTHLYFNF